MRCYVEIAAALGLLAGVAMPVLGQSSEPAGARAARRLEQLLEPGGKAAALPGSAPLAWPATKAVEQPPLPPAAFQVVLPRPPVATTKLRLPRPINEGTGPLARVALLPRIALPTSPLLQLPAVDVETPLPIPILARPKSDRATLDDVTLEPSRAATLERVRLRRRDPVPFTPVNLPDPFENIRAGGLRYPPAEQEQPPAVPIRTPAR